MSDIQCTITMILVNVAILFQNEIMTSKNIRSHRLNILSQNMELLRILFDDVLIHEPNTKEYIKGLMYFYEKLTDAQDILLPSFRQSIDKVMEVLVNINRLNLINEEA